jgi:hypothetical protein
VCAIVKQLAMLPVARPGGEWNSQCLSVAVAPFPAQVTLQPVFCTGLRPLLHGCLHLPAAAGTAVGLTLCCNVSPQLG